MKSPFGLIKYTYGLQSRYFAVAKADIRDTNLQLLKRMCPLELVFVSAFICLTMAIFPGWKPTYQYWGFLIAAAGVTALIYLCVLLKKTTYTAVMLLCVLFYITTLSGCISVDALTGSTNTAVFFQIVIVVLPAVFVLPFTVMDSINSAFSTPSDRVCQLGQVTFGYVFYDVMKKALMDVSKANNPKYMTSLSPRISVFFSFSFAAMTGRAFSAISRWMSMHSAALHTEGREVLALKIMLAAMMSTLPNRHIRLLLPLH